MLVELGSAIRGVAFALIVVGGGFLETANLIEAAVVAAPLGAAIARWYTTRYALGDEAVHLHRGLLWRTRQVLPRSNIQNVSTKAGLVARLGSVVELQISDASANGDIAIRVRLDRRSGPTRHRAPLDDGRPDPDPRRRAPDRR